MVRARALALPLVLVALIGLSGLSLTRVYNGPLLAGLVVGAALGSVAVSVALRRAPAWLVAPVSVAGLAGYSLAAIGISAHAGGVTGDLWTLAIDAGRNAVPRLLTALIPVEAQPDTVLGPIVLAWLAGFAGAELAARARQAAMALLPPVLLYAGTLILVGPNADVAVWQPLAFVGLAALGLVAHGADPDNLGPGTPEPRAPESGPPGSRPGLRAFGGVGLGVAAVLVVVAVASPFVVGLVGRAPIDPRRYVQPPNLDVLDENPLSRISGWAADPKQKLFDVRVLTSAHPNTSTGPSPSADPSATAAAGAEPDVSPSPSTSGSSSDGSGYDTRLRLAVLADWDGVTWHVDADYHSAGRVLPAVAAPPGFVSDPDVAAPLTVREQITVDDLQGRLLPAVSAPRRVDGVRVAYDPSTGTLLHADRLVPGVAYTVTSVSPAVDVNLLPGADVPSGPPVARYLAVGDTVPADLGHLAEQIVAGQGSPYLKALALESFLAEHYRFAADAPSGHAYPNLRFFLFDPARAGGQQGTSEQFAAAFAALGRLMGLPTRVVVGFRTPAGGGTVTAGDALAWPEVLFGGVGWVAFDPMPKPDTPSRPLEDEFLPKPTPPATPPASIEPSQDPTWTPPPSSIVDHAGRAGGLGTGVLVGGAGGGVVLVVALFLAVVVLLRARQRRARLDRGSPPQRVLGAWEEILDALALAGVPPARHLAAADIAVHAAKVVESGPDSSEPTTAGPRHAKKRQPSTPRPVAPRLANLAATVNIVGFAGDTVGAITGGIGGAYSGVVGGVAAGAVGPASSGMDELAAGAARSVAIEYEKLLRSRRSWWRRVLWRTSLRPLRRRKTNS